MKTNIPGSDLRFILASSGKENYQQNYLGTALCADM
jgi:hypothetical protein